jgi:hypothetical protein
MFDVTLNQMANAITVTHVSLHTDDPGTGAANELSGGTYSRAPIAYNPAAAGVRAQTADVFINVPAGKTVSWYVLWDGTTAKRKGDLPDEAFNQAGQYKLTGTTLSAQNPAPIV